MTDDIIATERLDLWSMTPAFLSASLHGQPELASSFAVPADWLAERALIEMRSSDLLADRDAQPWLLRAMVHRSTQQMIGHIGFHSPPGPAYLQDICPGAVEFGYTVYGEFRRQGFAREAARGLMAWAQRRHHVTDFIASADPRNVASVNLLRQLGFDRIGGHTDEVDGYEDIFRLHVGASAAS